MHPMSNSRSNIFTLIEKVESANSKRLIDTSSTIALAKHHLFNLMHILLSIIVIQNNF